MHCYSFNTAFQGPSTLPDLIILCIFTLSVLGHRYICPIYPSWRMLAKGHFCVRLARLCPMPSPKEEGLAAEIPGAFKIQESPKAGQPDPAQRALGRDVFLENYAILLENPVFFWK